METFSYDHINATQQIDIVNTIRRAGPLSSAEIVRLTGASAAAVNDITAQLMGLKLIYEKKIPGSDKRRLALRSDAVYVAGIWLAESDIICVVVDFLGDVKTTLQRPFEEGDKAPAALVSLVEQVLKTSIDNAKLQLDQIAAMGIGGLGLSDSKKSNDNRSRQPEKDESDLCRRIQHHFNIPVIVENHAVTAAMAYKWYGPGRDCDNYILVGLEDSVEMAVVFNGKIYRNRAGGGGEFGHMIIVPGGGTCRCGKRGCINAYVATRSIVKAAQRACELKELTCENPEQLSFENLIERANAHDEVVEDIFRQASNILGLGISTLIQIFCPTRIIITGRGVSAGELLFGPMREALAEYVSERLLATVEIVLHEGHPADGAKGAAISALMATCKKIVLPKWNR